MTPFINRLVTAILSVAAIATIVALDAEASTLIHPACVVPEATEDAEDGISSSNDAVEISSGGSSSTYGCQYADWERIQSEN